MFVRFRRWKVAACVHGLAITIEGHNGWFPRSPIRRWRVADWRTAEWTDRCRSTSCSAVAGKERYEQQYQSQAYVLYKRWSMQIENRALPLPPLDPEPCLLMRLLLLPLVQRISLLCCCYSCHRISLYTCTITAITTYARVTDTYAWPATNEKEQALRRTRLACDKYDGGDAEAAETTNRILLEGQTDIRKNAWWLGIMLELKRAVSSQWKHTLSRAAWASSLTGFKNVIPSAWGCL